MSWCFRQLIRPLGSLRYRLLALVLLPLLVLAVTVVLVGARWTTDYTYQQLFTKVNTDLRVAHDSFQRTQNEQQRNLAVLAQSDLLLDLYKHPTKVENWIAAQRTAKNYDYLMLLNADGTQRLTSAGWKSHKLLSSPITEKALVNPNSVSSNLELSAEQSLGGTGIEIVPYEVWHSDALLQGEHVVFPLIDTPRAAPTDRSTEDRAMVIRSIQAVRNAAGERIALLEGGRVLNRDFGFVDRIRDLVYGPGSLAPGSLGTVTVFLDDVRITTNVPSKNATRALGTRVSAEVRDTVLNQGLSWTDRAFVVNDWYISAYEPILDVHGKRVGMLYAGYLEEPFRHELYKAISVLAALVLMGCLFAIVVTTAGARSIFRPIESLTSVARATAAGERLRVGPLATVDEIEVLSGQFDEMLDTLETQRIKIEQDAHLLEDKVQSRTTELRQQNQRLTDSLTLLQQTRQQLETAEKLAALGELTAGVAHEINNPTAVILGNMDILISEIGDRRVEVQTEIDLIIQQVYRIRSITHRLVQYSRSKTELISPYSEALWLPKVVTDTVKLIRHDFMKESVSVRESHRCTQPTCIDKHELQQVLVNIVRNAFEAFTVEEASNRSREILIETDDVDDCEVSIRVTDNGVGIEPAHIARLFDPFFTARKERGTGLGLSVSYGIIHGHGGRIEVSSKLGVGSMFTVYLPVAVDNLSVSALDTSPDNTLGTENPSSLPAAEFENVLAENMLVEDVLAEFKR